MSPKKTGHHPLLFGDDKVVVEVLCNGLERIGVGTALVTGFGLPVRGNDIVFK